MSDIQTRARTLGATVSLPALLTRRPALGPAVAGLLGLVISLAGIGVPSIWYDEAATITSATRSWAQLGELIRSVDLVHAAYYSVIHLVFDVVGYSPVALRVPSAIAVGVAAALTVVLARMFTGPSRALLAGLVFCLLPRATWMGTEGRSYAFTAVFALLMTIVLVRAVRSGSRGAWVLYGALVVASTVVFIYLALIVIAHGIAVAWWAARARVSDREPEGTRSRWALVWWLVASVAAAVLLVPFVLGVVGQSGQLSWIHPLGPNTVRQVLQTQWFYRSPEFAIAGWALLLLGGIVLVRRSTGFSLAAVLIPIIVVPTLLLLVATATYSPLYTPRYLSMCLPFVAIVMASAIAALPTKLIAGLTVASLVVLAVPQIVDQRQPTTKENTSWSAVADLIARERAADGPDATTAVIWGPVRYHPSATARVIEYSYPQAFESTVDVTLRTPAAETGRLWETTNPLASSLGRLDGIDVTYLITSVTRDIRTETTTLLREEGWRPEASWRLVDVNIIRYVRN